MVETRTERLAMLLTAEGRSYDLWGDLNQRIREGRVVPIISNAVVNNRIFDIDEDGRICLGRDRAEDDEGHQLAIDERLARDWAEGIGYPLAAESPLLLCRVAQYDQIQGPYPGEAKTRYLNFLKVCLLKLADSDPDVAHIMDDLLEQIGDRSHLREVSFSEIAFQLSYPKYEDRQQDPLYVLAQLPLPNYVTTSHHDFMERALVDAGKYPRFRVCSCAGDGYSERPETEWFGLPPASGEDLDAEPTAVTPIVYHLYGLEKYPATLVISEDDYMEFLVKVSEDESVVRVSEDRVVVPRRLRRALTQSSMILLGYKLRSWEFRVLFRGIIKRILGSSKTQTPDKPNLAIQLNPPAEWKPDSEEMEQYLKEAKGYLQKYFEPNFTVEWDSTFGFAQKLLQKWREGTR